MIKKVIVILLISILKIEAQDTLFLKNGNKLPIIARKTIFLDLKTVRFKKIIANSLIGENFKIDSIQYVSTNDTNKIINLSNFNNTKLQYFRFRNDSNINLKITETLIKKLKEGKIKQTSQKEIKLNDDYTSLAFFIGYSNYLSNSDREILFSNQESAYILNQGLFESDISVYKPHKIGYGGKTRLNFSEINIQNVDVKQPYTDILFSIGPNYVLNNQNIDIILKMNLGVAITGSNNIEYEKNSNKYLINSGTSEIVPLINPSLEFRYSPFRKVKFLASMGYNSYRNNLTLKEQNSTETTIFSENKLFYQNLFDFKFGIAFNFKNK